MANLTWLVIWVPGFAVLVAAVAETGSLGLSDFVRIALGVASDQCTGQAQELFNALDRDGDQLLTVVELTFGGSYGDAGDVGSDDIEEAPRDSEVEETPHDSSSPGDSDEWNAAVAKLARLAFQWRWRQA